MTVTLEHFSPFGEKRSYRPYPPTTPNAVHDKRDLSVNNLVPKIPGHFLPCLDKELDGISNLIPMKKLLLFIVFFVALAACTKEETEPSITNFVLKAIPSGSFAMGCTTSVDPDCNPTQEGPVHNVTLSAFQISETEVTQELWQEVMESNPSGFPDCPKCPVEQMSWYDVLVFCNRLSEMKGLRPCYYLDDDRTQVYGKSGSTWWLPSIGTIYWNTAANGYRLPTEAEWEYAARGGSLSRGYIYAGSNSIDEVAWYDSNSGDKTHPVGEKKPNELGLYDMSGNVWEWCWDWIDTYPSSPQINPAGPKYGPYRVLRGGSWFYYPQNCRVANRYVGDPDVRLHDVFGFRLARTL